MKKAKKILLAVIALFGFVGIINVANAAELKSNFLDNLCVVKEGNKLVVKFDMLKTIDLTGDDPVADLDITVNGSETYGRGKEDINVLKIVPNSTTCSVTEVDGPSAKKQFLVKGMTVANYYTINSNKEAFVKDEDVKVNIDVKAGDYTYESIEYSVKDGKIASIDSGIDRLGEIELEAVNHFHTTSDEYFQFVGEYEEGSYSIYQEVTLSDGIYIGRLISVADYKNKTTAEVIKELDAGVASGEGFEGYVTREDATVSKEAFATIKEKGYIIKMPQYEYVEGEEWVEPTLLYTWTFDGTKMKTTDVDVNLNLAIGNEEKEKNMKSLLPASKDKPLSLTFDHHGNLPEGTTVTVNVAGHYENGDKLVLYYYNGEKLEETSANLDVVDGYVTFVLEHCSEYVLAKEVGNNAQTSNIDVALYMTVAGISVAGIIALIISKKKIA